MSMQKALFSACNDFRISTLTNSIEKLFFKVWGKIIWTHHTPKMGVLAVMENHDHEKLKYPLKVYQLIYHDGDQNSLLYTKLALSWCHHICLVKWWWIWMGQTSFIHIKQITLQTSLWEKVCKLLLYVNLHVTHITSTASYRKIKWLINTKVTWQATLPNIPCTLMA